MYVCTYVCIICVCAQVTNGQIHTKVLAYLQVHMKTKRLRAHMRVETDETLLSIMMEGFQREHGWFLSPKWLQAHGDIAIKSEICIN